MLLVALWRMKNRNGWSAIKGGGGLGKERSIMTAAVAAAASVPSSFTSTKALCTTFDRNRSFDGDMPVMKDGAGKEIQACCHFNFLMASRFTSHLRSRSLLRQRHPPCPCWPGRSSGRTSPPSWTEADPAALQRRPSCQGESTPWRFRRSALSPTSEHRTF